MMSEVVSGTVLMIPSIIAAKLVQYDPSLSTAMREQRWSSVSASSSSRMEGSARINSVPGTKRGHWLAAAAVGESGVRYLAISALLASCVLVEGLANIAGSKQGARLLFSKPFVRALLQSQAAQRSLHAARAADLCSHASCMERV